MPIITYEKHYEGFQAKLKRLGVEPLMAELREILTGFELRVCEEVDSNGVPALRMLIDARFEAADGWSKEIAAGADWTKCKRLAGAELRVGVDIQFSGWGDLVAVPILRLRQSVNKGEVDVGVIVVPDDRLAPFLTDRCPSLRQTARHVDEWRVDDFPLALIGFEHDGPGPALVNQPKAPAGSPKKPRKRQSKGSGGTPPPEASTD